MASVRKVGDKSLEFSKDFFLCQTCKNGLREGKYRWYQHKTRRNGVHYMCQDCKEVKNYAKCICGSMVSKKPDPLFQQMFNAAVSIKFKCLNHERGCTTILGEEALKAHEINCIYRLVTCPGFGCESMVPFHELLKHMKSSNHWGISYVMAKGEEIVDNYEVPEEALRVGGFKRKPAQIFYDGKVFVYDLVNYVGGENVYFWIQLIGSPEEAKNYCYTLKFHGNKPHIYTIYSGEMNSIEESFDEIIFFHNNCFGIKFSIFKKQFLDENREYKVSIGIKNMKEEAKDDIKDSGNSNKD